MEVARYGKQFKDRVVARLLPPESEAPEIVSREVGVTVQTLERWRSDALLQPARERIWTAAARLEAVIATAAMDGAARGGLVPGARRVRRAARAVARQRDAGAGGA